MNNIILSIHHRHAENIFDGKKTVELRKSLPREMPGKVYLYDTQEKKIVGYFVPKKLVVRRLCVTYDAVEHFSNLACITPKEFIDYYGRGHGYPRYYEINFALRFVNPIPLPLGIRAPQNFVYCGELEVK